MKQWRLWILMLLALSFASSLLAEEKGEEKKSAFVSGVNSYGAEMIESVQGSGLIKLNGTTITESLRLNGSLLSQNAQIALVDVSGEANFTGTTISKGGTVLGSIQATRSNFQGNLTLLTQKAVFTATQLQGITFRQDPSFRGKQVLELKQGTIVHGSIVFESGKGEVLLSSGSQILGSVKGGKIVRR